MRKYHVGILGCGVISRTYVSDIQTFYPALHIVSCADTRAEAAANLAEAFHIPRVCTPEELLEDEDVDIVVNLTPPQMHVPLNRKILQAGRHLFCEKPFAPTLQEAEELLKLAEEKGVMAACAPDTFLASGLQSVRYYLDTGLIGKPFFVTANMTSFGPETWHPAPEAFYRRGAGPVFDMGPYYLSALTALLGPIESISAIGTSASPSRHIYVGPEAGGEIVPEVNTHVSALLKMQSGIPVSLNISFDIYRSHLPMFEIYGDGGTLAYPDPNFGGGTPQVYRKEQYTDTVYQHTPEAEERRRAFRDLPELFTRHRDYSRGIGVLDLASAIENKRQPRCGGDFLLHVTEALEGLMIASENGKAVTMRTSCARPLPLTPGSAIDQV